MKSTEARVVVLARTRTRTERRLVGEWAESHHPDAAVVQVRDRAPAESWSDATTLVPVRISWVSVPSPTRRPAELLVTLMPHRPPSMLQKALIKNAPGRADVVVGESATVADLRSRFAAETGGQSSFGSFVARAATLACDRAERRLIGDRYKVPRQVVEQITASRQFAERVATLAQKLGRPVADVATDATGCLGELATVQSPAAIDAFRTVLSPMHSRTWNVHVDTESLERVRAATAKSGVVFLPAHRSYVDPLVLAEVLHAHDFPRNHVLGGNNMQFWPIGPLGKRAGLVFIRRSNADDEVYKFALREYLAYLTSKRFNLEWYIEGGRSRTGKLRPPKLGLLAYLVRALDSGATEDVALVPVSIAYDQLNEVGAMDAEQAGAAKAAEGTRWLAHYVRAQLRDRGHAWVRFGEPFSLRDALANAGEGPTRLEKVGFQICDGINRATPVTPTALVTFALLGSPGRALTLSEVERVSAPLLDYFERRSVPCADTGLSLRTAAGLRDALDRLVAVGVAAEFAGGPEPVWSIRTGQDRIAAFYRNGAIHHLVTRGITELALLHVAGRGLAIDDALQEAYGEARRLRDLLKFEFFFPPTEQFRADLLAELELIAPDWGDPQRGASELLSATNLLVAHRALRSFVDAQFVLARALADLAPGVEPGEEFLTHCLGLGQQMYLRGRLEQADSVSRELYATALRLAAHRGLVAAGGESVAAGRREFLTEVSGVLDRLSEIARLEEGLLEVVLDRWEPTGRHTP
ncbi:MAG: glycerol-3-phosphate 1-O-acyltransferase [Sporichthyaceae bacterium]